MVRAVLDVNVVLSGLLNPNGAPGRVLGAFLDSRFQLVTSVGYLSETTEVLGRDKFDGRPHFQERGRLVMRAMTKDGYLSRAVPTTEVTVRDPKDQYLVALAISSGANVLISGDDDLLAVAGDLRPFGVEVVTPARFVEILGDG